MNIALTDRERLLALEEAERAFPMNEDEFRAFYELTARPEVPTAVVLDEAIELAKLLSTADSGRFVNGLLGKIAEQEL